MLEALRILRLLRDCVQTVAVTYSYAQLILLPNGTEKNAKQNMVFTKPNCDKKE